MDGLPLFLLFFQLIAFGVSTSENLTCFHCVSQVSLDELKAAEIDAFKVFMFARYNVPPSHQYCQNSKAYEFLTIPTEHCSTNDSCVMTRIKSQNITFVLRGCLSKLLKNGYNFNRNYTCNSSENASCLCQTKLCNSATLTLNLKFFTFLFVLMQILFQF